MCSIRVKPRWGAGWDTYGICVHFKTLFWVGMQQ